MANGFDGELIWQQAKQVEETFLVLVKESVDMPDDLWLEQREQMLTAFTYLLDAFMAVNFRLKQVLDEE